MKRYFKGFKFSLGVVLILFLIGVVYSVGFHTPSEILPGTFVGDYVVNGNIGVGANPVAGIYINKHSQWTSATWSRHLVIQNGAMQIGYGSGTRWGLGRDIDNGFQIFHSTVDDTSAGYVSDLVIANTGNIGVGTISPIQKLDVNGKIRMASQTSSSDSADTVATKGYVDSNSGNSLWTPIEISLGSLRQSSGTSTYTLPASIPASAKEVLVYVWARKGNYGGNEHILYRIYTSDGTNNYLQKFSLFEYSNSAWVHNSDNLWFPITSNRRIYVNLNQGIAGNYEGGIEILGYR